MITFIYMMYLRLDCTYITLKDNSNPIFIKVYCLRAQIPLYGVLRLKLIHDRDEKQQRWRTLQKPSWPTRAMADGKPHKRRNSIKVVTSETSLKQTDAQVE